MSVFFIGTFLTQLGPSKVAHEERVSLPVFCLRFGVVRYLFTRPVKAGGK